MKIDDTKEKILNVAEKLFSRFGFHKTSMDEIAKISRKAKGSLYYHFENKEALYKEVVYKEIKNLMNKLNSIINNTELSASDKIRNYLTTRMDVLYHSVNYHDTLKADFYERYDFIDDLRSDLDKWEKNKIKTIIEEGIHKNEFLNMKNIDSLIEMFIMVFKGLETPFLIQDKYVQYIDNYTELGNVFIQGIKK